METHKHIYSKESEELKNTFSSLISSHNTLCAIEEAFASDETALKFFEKAREEVLSSGNAGLGSMFSIAISEMAEVIRDAEDDTTTDVDVLRMKIYGLESENRKLKSQLESIKSLMEKFK